MKTKLPDFWTGEDISILDGVKTFGDIGEVALKVVQRFPIPHGQVCGPLSTGGTGSFEANVQAMAHAIGRLKSEGKPLFSQLPMEDSMLRVKAIQGARHDPFELLEEVYGRIFKTGKVNPLYFMQNWKESQGARWEHERGLQHSLEIIYLRPKYS